MTIPPRLSFSPLSCNIMLLGDERLPDLFISTSMRHIVLTTKHIFDVEDIDVLQHDYIQSTVQRKTGFLISLFHNIECFCLTNSVFLCFVCECVRSEKTSPVCAHERCRGGEKGRVGRCGKSKCHI